MALGRFDDVLGRTHGHHLSAARAAFGAHVDDPVSGFDHVQIVLNHHDGVARIAQLVQHLEQQLHIGKVQAGGGLIQDVERAARVAFGQFLGQLDALGLTAGQRGGALTQTDIPQPHIQQRLQLARNAGHVLEKGVRFFYRHAQHVGNVPALPLHFQCFAVVALAVAGIAGHIHIRQKVHFYLDHAVALAGFAAASGHVERETTGAVATLFGGIGFGKQFANRGKQAGIGGRVAAWCAANGGLVHVDDLVEMLQPFQRLVGGRFGAGAVQLARHFGVQRVVDQGTFA